MSKWRLAVVLILLTAPFLFLAGYGSYVLWIEGWSFWAWWPMSASLTLAYVLGWHWQRKKKLLHLDFTPETHWTDRDKEAWKIVEARGKAADQLDPEKLVQFSFYSDTAQELALEMARFYHPRSKDPFGSLTIPEMLAVVELASHDLTEMVDQYLPGGHLMTVNDWIKAKKATDYYQTANKIYWAVSAVLSPFSTATRYLASQAGMSRPFALLQNNLLVWFYVAFLQRLGTYLIDLNSGRLRVGAARYREMLDAHKAATAKAAAPPARAATPAEDKDRTEVVPEEEEPAAAAQVTIGLLGQVKAGKSSLTNAFLGEQRAITSVLPETNEVTRYQLRHPGLPSRLDILDTVGYGHTGPREDQLPGTRDAACKSDVLLMVLHARSAAREADLKMLRGLKSWFDSHPELKSPRILAVLTHIDLLSPAMEWQPPYQWQTPTRTKEKQIAEAIATVRETMGEYLVGVVPVCTADGRIYGLEEWLMPALVELLDEGRAVALLRCLKAEVDSIKIRKLLNQFVAAGKQAASILWEVAIAPKR